MVSRTHQRTPHLAAGEHATLRTGAAGEQVAGTASRGTNKRLCANTTINTGNLQLLFFLVPEQL